MTAAAPAAVAVVVVAVAPHSYHDVSGVNDLHSLQWQWQWVRAISPR